MGKAIPRFPQLPSRKFNPRKFGRLKCRPNSGHKLVKFGCTAAPHEFYLFFPTRLDPYLNGERHLSRDRELFQPKSRRYAATTPNVHTTVAGVEPRSSGLRRCATTTPNRFFCFAVFVVQVVVRQQLLPRSPAVRPASPLPTHEGRRGQVAIG